jgi:hypothetical protein
MTKHILVDAAYAARRPREAMSREAMSRTSPRMSPGPAFTVVALLSLGLWWAIWAAVSSLVFG